MSNLSTLFVLLGMICNTDILATWRM